MIKGRYCDIPQGRACLWSLPPDASIAARARQLVAETLGNLAFPLEEIDNGRLAVSELATNVHQHAGTALPYGAVPELWMWARSYPGRELVVSMFDACRERVPVAGAGSGADEHGRGLAMVGEVCSAWGSAASRSMLHARPVPGKSVWFTLPLPEPWPGTGRLASPSRTARCLHAMLDRRGVHGVITTHADTVSMVSAPCGINVAVEPAALRHPAPDGSRVRRPLADLNDVSEHIVRRTETLAIRPGYSMSPGPQ